MAEVASAYVSLIPSAKGFGRGISSQIDGDVSRAGRTSGRVFGTTFAKTGMGPIKSMIGVVGKSMIAGFAAVAGTKFLTGAISDASDLEEAGSKVNVVFGKQGDAIRKAAETSATSMGLTKSAYLGATGSLGNLLVALKIAPDAAAGMSQKMVKLAGDLASFNNVKPEEALQALQSGLTGETEPLKRFGVNMNDAMLKAQALKLGLIKTTKDALTPQNKALAAQALIFDQTGKAQGDFERTSGGLANQQRILAAQFGDVKAQIGSALLPVVTRLVSFFTSNLLPAFRRVKEVVGVVASAFKAGFSGLEPAAGGLSAFVWQVGQGAQSLYQMFQANVVPVLKQLAGFIIDTVVPAFQTFVGFLVGTVIPAALSLVAAFQENILPIIQRVASFVQANLVPVFTLIAGIFTATLIPAVIAVVGPVVGFIGALTSLSGIAGLVSAAIAAIGGPVVLIGAAIAALVAGVIYAYQNFEGFREVVNNFAATLQGAFANVLAYARKVWPQVQEAISHVIAVVRTVIERFVAIAVAVWKMWGDELLRVAKAIWTAVQGVVTAGVKIVQGIIETVTSIINGDWSDAWDGIKKIVSGAWDAIKAVVKLALSLISTAIDMAMEGVAKLWGLAWDAIKKAVPVAFDAVIGFLKTVPGLMLSALGKLGDLLLEAGKDLIRGLINGIKSMAGAAADAAKNAVKGAVDGAKSFLGIRSPSTVFAEIGRQVGQGFINGMTGTADQISATGEALSAKVVESFAKMKTGVDEQINGVIASGTNKLTNLANQMTATFDNFKSIAAATTGAGALAGLGRDENGVTAAGVIADLKQRVTDAAGFAANLLKLQNLGLNKQALAELAAAGAEQGAAVAAALVEAGGSAIRVVNTLEGQLTDAGMRVASVGSAAMFEAGIQTARGLARGFASQRQEIEAEMLKIAKSMQAAIKKALGIKSPSSVFAEFGRNIIRGLTVGILDTRNQPVRALQQVGGSLGTGWSARNLQGIASSPVGAQYSVVIEAAPTVPTEQQIIPILKRFEALHFQPA